MEKWLYLFQALRKGSRLADAETWKTRQALSMAIPAVLMPLWAFARAVGWIPDGISDAEVTDIGVALGGFLFGVANIYATFATSTKVGLPAQAGIPKIVGPAASANTVPEPSHPDSADRLREPERPADPEPLPPNPEGITRGNGGFPRGPFFE